MNSKTLIFAYGSNLNPDRMRERIPSTRFLGRARLARHELRFHLRGSLDGTAKADAWLTDDPGHEVYGVVWEIDRSELPELDRIEGGYVRRTHRLRLESGPRSGEWIEAQGYHGRAEGVDPELRPFDWYLGHVLKGARDHGLPASVVRKLERVPTRSSASASRTGS